MLSTSFPEVRFIQSTANLGFARANNAAFPHSHGEFVLFLNPDTEIPGPSLSAMIGFMRSHSNVGILGCKLLNSDHTLQTSCVQSFPTLLNQTLDSDFLRRIWPNSSLWGTTALTSRSLEPKVVPALSGACIMLRRSVFTQVGMFSEEYHMYAEDIDLSYKVLKANFLCYYLPTALVIHHGGGSSKTIQPDLTVIAMREAVWRFLVKTRGSTYGKIYRLLIAVSAIFRIFVALFISLIQIICQNDSRSSLAVVRKYRAVFLWSTLRLKALTSPNNTPSAFL